MFKRMLNRLLRPHPAEQSRSVWFCEEARAERFANLIRIVYWFFWLISVTPAFSMHPLSANVANISGGGLSIMVALFYHLYLMKRPYNRSLKYLSTAFDVLVTTAILFAYHYSMGYSTTLKAPPFMNYLMTLALASFRFNSFLPLYGGLLSSLAYTFLLVYMMITQNVEFGSILDIFTTPRINLVYQVYRLTYLAALTVMLSMLVQHVHRLVHLRVSQTEKALTEKAKREQTQQLLERYFTPEIARYLTDNPQEMGGETQRVTILFSDLRSFTTLSEQLGPAASVALLNTVFDNLVRIVFKYQGTLDKFLGDGMLVVFGVPHPQPDDARRAVQAAEEMVRAVKHLDNVREIDIGIAVHSGEVIFGNIGSPHRMELTVIGDAVNTTARIEELNKKFGTNIILSETTRREIGETFPIRPLAAHQLRGKTERIQLFTLAEATETANE